MHLPKINKQARLLLCTGIAGRLHKKIFLTFFISLVAPLVIPSNAFGQINTPCDTISHDYWSGRSPQILLDTVIARFNTGSPEFGCYDELYRELHFSEELDRYNYYQLIIKALLYQGNSSKTEEVFQEFRSFAFAAEDKSFEAGYWYSTGNYYWMVVAEQLDSAIYAYQKAAALYIENGDKHKLYLVYCNLSSVYLDQKKYDAAYQYLLMAEKLMNEREGLVRELERAILRNNIGVTHLRRKQYEKADSIFRKVEESMLHSEEGAYPIALSLLNRMDIAITLEEWEKAAAIQQKLGPYLSEFEYLFPFYAKIAFDLHLGAGDYEKARAMINRFEAYILKKDIEKPADYFAMQIDYHLAFKQAKEALKDIQQAASLADLDRKTLIYLSRSRLNAYLLQGDEASALRESKNLQEQSEALQEEQQQRHQEEMAAIYELESYKAAKDRAESIAKLAEERTKLLERNYLYLGAALLFAMAGLVLLGFLFKSNKQRVLEEQIRVQTAKKHSQQLEKQLKVQRQNAFHSGIGAAQLKTNIMDAVSRYAPKAKMLERKLSILLHEYAEQSNFVELFLLSYPDFFKALTKMAPDLTQSQLRYAILIALGASMVEISETLGVSEHAVKMARYRLKGKLGLDKEESIEQYLRELLLQE